MLVTLAVLVPLVLIAGYIAMVFVMNPTEDDRGYLHALHRDDPAVFLDHTDQQMLSIGHEICRMIQDPKGPSDFSYAGDVAGAAYQYLCLD